MREADFRAEPPVSLGEFLYHAHVNRRAAGLAGACVLGLALLTAALMAPSYRATATLAVLPSPEFTVREAAGSHDANASALALDQIMKAESEILGSDELHLAAMRKVGPARLYPEVFDPAPRNLLRRVLHAVAGTLLSPWRVAPADEAAAREEHGVRLFGAHLHVLPAKDANVISVTFDNHDNARAAATLNALLGLYAARRIALYDDPQVEIVRHEAEAGSRAVAEADERMAAFKRDHAISSYENERDMLLSRRNQAEQARDEADASLGEHTARLAVLTQLLAAEKPTISLYTEQDGDVRLQTANADLEDVRAKLAAAREKYREGSRMVTGLKAQLDAHEAEQGRLTQDRKLSVVREGRNPAIDALRLDRSREQSEQAAARARVAAEASEVTQLGGRLAALDADEAALAALTRQRASAEDAYRSVTRILADRHLSEAEDAQRLANVRVIQPALVPQTPRATPLLVIAAGVLLGGLASFGWLVLAFLRRPVFFTEEGLAAASGVPVLGVLERELVAA